MEPKTFHRKLAAILSADVAGYSRLMQDDETATVATLQSYKQAFSDLIKQHRGRVVDSPGDNLLAEFASVVDAVQCAVAVLKGTLRINPRFSLEWVDRVAAYKDRAPVKTFIDAMRKAGLPDKPPPPQP